MLRLRTASLALLLAVVGHALPAAAVAVPFVSDATWEVYDAIPPAGTLLGTAQDVCASGQLPCPWTTDLSAVPGAVWIWGPGVTSATTPSELVEYCFVRTFQLGASPSGSIRVAADDLGEVFVNGVSLGTHGSITDAGEASNGQNVLALFDLTPYLQPGANQLVIRAQNGPGSFAGNCGPCSYGSNPAAVVFAGMVEDGSTASTVTTTSSTTTTLLPTICAQAPVGPTFLSLDCRLDALVTRIQSSTEITSQQSQLVEQVTKARGQKVRAEGRCALSDAKHARGQLKQAIRKMIQFGHRVRSKTGRRSMPAALRAELIAAGDAIKADLQALRGALRCPDDALPG